MPTQEELSLLLAEDPENFSLLHDMAFLLHQNRNYPACFVVLERAIASYEAKPVPQLQTHYFDIKRLHAHLQHDRMPNILGDAYPLIDKRWTPVFKLGRPREMAWKVTSANMQNIVPALTSPMLKKLRFLSINVTENVDDFLEQMIRCPLQMIRALSICSTDTPSFSLFQQFFTTHKADFESLNTLTLRMPRINNTMAVCARNCLASPEAFNLTSMDRSLMTPEFCEMLADDTRSNALTRLSLVGTSVGNEGLFAIMSSENFSSLQVLDMHDGILNNGAAKVIVSAHNLPNLHSIDLRYNQIDPAGLNMLEKSPIKCLTEGQHTRPEGRE